MIGFSDILWFIWFSNLNSKQLKQCLNVFFCCCLISKLCTNLCDPMDCSYADTLPCPSVYPWSLLKLIFTASIMPSNHLILCHPFLLLPSIFPSIGVFSNESALCIKWPKYWNFSFSISSSNEYPGLISFRMDWLALLAVQGTLKTLLQHHSSNASVLRRSAFFTVQLSHPYMTTGKTIALTRRTFVGKVISLLLNMLSRLVITFLPRSKHLFNFMAAITICRDFGAQKNKVSHCFPIYFPWSDGTRNNLGVY